MDMNMPMGPPAAAPQGMDMMGGGGMMMQMTFYWGKQVTLLFESWETKNLRAYILSLLAIFVFAMLHQWLASFRASLARALRSRKPQPPSGGLEAGSASAAAADLPIAPLLRLLLSLLFGLNAATGYLLMLIVMTVNTGVFLVVLLGLTTSHFLFDKGSNAGMTGM